MHPILNLLVAGLFCLLACDSKSKEDEQDYLVDLGGYDIHFRVWPGSGTPILFEAGGLNDAEIWNEFIPRLRQQTGAPLITYDRAGFGQSGINPRLPDEEKCLIKHGVADLEKGLKEIGYEQELILVAHSYGGFCAAHFAARNPQKVQGIVLLDASLNCIFTPDLIEKFREMTTPEFVDNMKDQGPGFYYTALSFLQTVQNMKAIKFPSSVPILDIVAENPPNNFNDEEDVKKWHACHEAFSQAYPNRRSLLAKNSGHYVFLDAPELVVKALLEFYDDLQNQE
ncbi:MAG: alpha/beta hydrolase [Bacteroidota bacterium]